MCATHVVQAPQRGQRTIGAEHRIGDDECAFLIPARKRRCHRVDVAVWRDHDPGPRQPAGIHQGCVRGCVGDHQRTGTGQAHHRSQVGGIARGEHQRGLGTDEIGQCRLELLVQLGVAGDQTRSGRPAAPGPQRRNTALDHLGMLRQSQIVVGREVDLAGHRRPGAQRSAQPGRPALVLDGVEPGQRGGLGTRGQSGSHRLLA